MHNFASNKRVNRWVTLSTVAVLIGGGTTACGKFETTQALVSEAKQYQQKGDSQAAIIQLKNALQKNPDDAEARYVLGMIYQENGDPLSSEKELRKALVLGMGRDKVMPGLGKVLLMQGQFQKVLDETGQTAGKGPASPEILGVRGKAYLALGKYQDAKLLFEQALQARADFADALLGMARLAIVDKDIDAATRFADLAVDKNPKDIDAWLFKGDLLRAQGKIEPALDAYGEAMKIMPNNTPAHLSRASVELAAEKFDAARADIEAARKKAPKNLMVYYLQALLDFRQGKNAAALDSLQQILSAAPNHMPSVLLAGAVQFSLGSLPQAEQHLKAYLEKDPNNLYARKLLVATRLKSRQTKAALDVLQRALKEAPQDAQLLALAGEAYMQAKDFTKATEYFEKASAIAPKNPKLHTSLGLSRLAQGENERAVAELETAATLDTQSSQADVLLIMTYLSRQENDKAMAALKNMETAQPNNPLTHNLKGAIYLAKKDKISARASFEKALSLQPAYFPAAMNLAQLDLQEKNPASAQKRFEAILEKDKGNLQAMIALAQLAIIQGQGKEVESWLQRANKEHPEALQPITLLVGHYLKTGEKKKALDLAQKMQASHPESPELLDLLAQTYLAGDNKEKALESYERLAAVMPGSALAQYRIAAVHKAMQNERAAYGGLKKALALQPDYLDAQLALADMELRKGNHDEALKIARQIQKQREKSPVGYLLEGDSFMAQTKPGLAVKAYEQGLAISKNSLLMMKLHAALSQSGKVKEAETRILQWLKEHPADTSVRMYLAHSYLGAKKSKAAIEQYQSVLLQEPKNSLALNNLAWLYQHEKDPRALNYAEQAYQVGPNNPSILDTLGWMLVEQGNTTRGLPLLQKATSLAPEAAEIHYHLVLGLVKSGDKAKARKELEQLLATGKTFSRIEEARALLKQL